MKHKSNKLENFLGKKVKITFFDNDVKIGILEKNIGVFEHTHPYQINDLVFCKSHVKKIEEV